MPNAFELSSSSTVSMRRRACASVKLLEPVVLGEKAAQPYMRVGTVGLLITTPLDGFRGLPLDDGAILSSERLQITEPEFERDEGGDLLAHLGYIRHRHAPTLGLSR